MRFIKIDSVEAGQTLGKTIYSSNGSVLLAEGIMLTVYMINILKRIGVTMIYIKDPNLEDFEIEEVVSDETKRHVMHRMAEMMEAVKSGKDFNSQTLNVSIDKLLEEVAGHKDLLLQMTDIRTSDNAAFLHAMNVCTMSLMMGINMNLNMHQLRDLAIGGLLHDVGKLDSLSDDQSENESWHHTWRGFELLKKKREYNLLVAHVALQHHEAVDGSGRPRSLDGEEIHQYAKIVAVANTYDNLIAGEWEEERIMLPDEACEQLMGLSGTKLDHDTVIQFLRIVSVYPTGTSVKLTNKQTGVVVGQHRGLPGRPVIRIIHTDTDGEMEVKELDLSRNPTIFIESVL